MTIIVLLLVCGILVGQHRLTLILVHTSDCCIGDLFCVVQKVFWWTHGECMWTYPLLWLPPSDNLMNPTLIHLILTAYSDWSIQRQTCRVTQVPLKSHNMVNFTQVACLPLSLVKNHVNYFDNKLKIPRSCRWRRQITVTFSRRRWSKKSVVFFCILRMNCKNKINLESEFFHLWKEAHSFVSYPLFY